MLDMSETFSFGASKLYAERLETKYPFLTCCVIGRTHLGRGIFSFSLGNKSNSAVIVGGTCAKSSQTSLALYRFIDNVCDCMYRKTELSGINFSALTEKFGITVIPCLNPDSVQIAYENKTPAFFQNKYDAKNWNSNAAGVDIDLNFDSDWRKEKIASLEKNIISACAEGFPGNMKESEPETRAFSSFCRRNAFRSCFTLKSGEQSRIYYRRKDSYPANSAMMAKIISSSYPCRLMQSEMPACASRWFSDTFSKPAFLLETQTCLTGAQLYSKLEEALVLMCVM